MGAGKKAVAVRAQMESDGNICHMLLKAVGGFHLPLFSKHQCASLSDIEPSFIRLVVTLLDLLFR